MFINQPSQQRGAWKINTAQAIIIVIALACVGVVLDAYQKSHETPLSPAPTPARDPRLVRYADEMKLWQARLSPSGMTLTWPYLGQDDAVRIDLPKQQPVTLAPWDTGDIHKVTQGCYDGFVETRRKAKVANPEGCLVHVFLPNPNGEFVDEVAIGSASGVSSPQQD